MKKEPMLLKFIPYGKVNAIRRSTLADLTNLTDRQVRSSIKCLTKDYGVIANYETGGYYRAEKIDELEEAILVELARVIAIQKTIRDLEKYKIKLESGI